MPQQTFKEFFNSDSLEDCLQNFKRLLLESNIHELEGKPEVYEALKKEYVSIESDFFQLLDSRMAREEYKSKPLKGKKILIVGGGPAGIFTAIESVLLGGSPIIMEKRISYSRNNVILLWDYAMETLKSLGIKTIDKKFCVGSLHHVGIRRLQCSLLKVALMLGIEFHPGVVFERPVPQGKSWAAEVSSFDGEISDDDQENIHKENIPSSSDRHKYLFEVRGDVLHFDALIGADGLNSRVAEVAGYERITMKAKPAIGVTFNFVNSRSSEENALDEFGVSSYCQQETFKNLKDKYSIELENCVYYRDETHYFVCTVPKEVLLSLGVFKSDKSCYSELLAPENCNREELAKFCRRVATHFGLPDKTPFEINHRGEKDIQVFDFTKKLASTEQVKFLSGDHGQTELFVALVGDGLLEPFWPLGTGANRAILSSQDALFSMSEFFSGVPKDKLLERASKIHSQLKLVESSDIKTSKGGENRFLVGETHYSDATIDPQTRYRNLVY